MPVLLASMSMRNSLRSKLLRINQLEMVHVCSSPVSSLMTNANFFANILVKIHLRYGLPFAPNVWVNCCWNVICIFSDLSNMHPFWSIKDRIVTLLLRSTFTTRTHPAAFVPTHLDSANATFVLSVKHWSKANFTASTPAAVSSLSLSFKFLSFLLFYFFQSLILYLPQLILVALYEVNYYFLLRIDPVKVCLTNVLIQSLLIWEWRSDLPVTGSLPAKSKLYNLWSVFVVCIANDLKNPR